MSLKHGLLVLSFALAAAGCGSESFPEAVGAPCPCVDGQVCCALTQVCAESQDQCPAPVRFDRVEPRVGAASGGYLLSLRGAGLGHVVEVELGEKTCTDLERVSDAELRCRAPKGAAWGGRASIRLLGENEAELAMADDAFRWAEFRFVDRAAEWGVRRSVQGAGVSLLRPGLGGRTWFFFGVDRFQERVDFQFVIETPDLWRPSGMGYAHADIDPLAELSTLAPSDYDNDGRVEVLGARTFELWGGPLSMLELREDGSAVEEPTALEDYEHLLPLDIDGDHDIDLFACNPVTLMGPRPLSVLTNDGRANFTTQRIELENSLGCTSPQAGDVDGDLRPEIFIRSGAVFGLYSVQGGTLVDVTQDWGLLSVLGALPFATSMAHFVDIDLDGDQDLALIGTGKVDIRAEDVPQMRQSGLIIYRNRFADTGERRFELIGGLDLPGPDRFDCVPDTDGLENASLRWGLSTSVWFDADLDGDQDVLLPAPSGRCIFGPALYINRIDEGREGFTLSALSTDWFHLAPKGAAAGDLDGDGDLDVLFGHRQLGTRAVYINQAKEQAGKTMRHLVVRPVSDPDGDATDADGTDDRLEPSMVVELDLDGDDFERDASLRSQTTGSMRSAQSHGLFEAHFGLGAHEGPVWVRTLFPDGSMVVRRVEPSKTVVQLRDCAAEAC